MPTTDDELDARSRQLLHELSDLKRLELEKRRRGRSSAAFHKLAEAVDAKARRVFEVAGAERIEGEHDSPVPAERAEQRPGDWAAGRRN
jgi:hypothetical protein